MQQKGHPKSEIISQEDYFPFFVAFQNIWRCWSYSKNISLSLVALAPIYNMLKACSLVAFLAREIPPLLWSLWEQRSLCLSTFFFVRFVGVFFFFFCTGNTLFDCLAINLLLINFNNMLFRKKIRKLKIWAMITTLITQKIWHWQGPYDDMKHDQCN